MPFLISFALALVTMPLARWIGRVMGIVDRPVDARLKIHSAPVPVTGGAAIVGIWVATVAGLGLDVPGHVVFSVVVALAIGLADDARPLPAWLRVLAVAGGGAVFGWGSFWSTPLPIVKVVGVVLLVVACANAVNLLDGQDGLAGGLTLFAALGLAGLAAGLAQTSAEGFGLALAGALAGFLVWNLPPARIYLGNGGAYAVGVLLAVLATVVVSRAGWPGFLAAGACLALFAFELLLTVVRRAATRRPLVGGDRLHTYDLVAARGWSRARVTVVFCALGAAAALVGIIMRNLPLSVSASLAAVGSGAAVVVAFWLWRTGKPGPDGLPT